jgi:putative transposase
MKTNTNDYRGYRFPPEIISHSVYLCQRFCLSYRDVEELLAKRLDEVFVNIQGQRHYLWRAVDQDGDLIDILVQRRRNARAAKRFFRRLLKGQGSEPWRLVTDKLKSYSASPTIGELPAATCPLFQRMECGHGCLSYPTDRGSGFTSEPLS